MLLKRRYVRQFIDRVLAGFVTRVNVVGRNLRRVVTDQVTRDGLRNAHRFQLADSRVTKAMKRNLVSNPGAVALDPGCLGFGSSLFVEAASSSTRSKRLLFGFRLLVHSPTITAF